MLAWAGVAVSLGLLVATFRNVEFQEVGASLRQIQLAPWAAAVLLTVATYVVRAWRWQVMMRPPISFRHAFGTSMIGLFVSNILPARLGELVRVEMIARLEGASRSTTLGTLVLERVLDMGGILAIYAAVAFSSPLPPALRSLAFPAALGSAACLALPLLLGNRPRARARFADALGRWTPRQFSERIRPRLHRLLEGTALHPGRRPIIFLQTGIIWIVTAASVEACLRACGLDIPTAGVFFTLASLVLGSLLPTTPGLIGTHEFFAKESVGLFSDLHAEAAAFAITSHLAWLVPVSCLGFYYMNRYQLDLKTMRKLKGSNT